MGERPYDKSKASGLPLQPQPKRFAQPASKVISEFVDAIPEPSGTEYLKKINSTRFESQPGVVEALQKAFDNPGRALILVQYTEGPKARRYNNAKLRVMSIEKQGYNEGTGWTVRNVEDKVYVMYNGGGEWG